MSEDIAITNEEYKQLVDFHNKKIDHVYIQPHDESNPTMICHGGNGKILYNGRLHDLSDIIEDVNEDVLNCKFNPEHVQFSYC